MVLSSSCEDVHKGQSCTTLLLQVLHPFDGNDQPEEQQQEQGEHEEQEQQHALLSQDEGVHDVQQDQQHQHQQDEGGAFPGAGHATQLFMQESLPDFQTQV